MLSFLKRFFQRFMEDRVLDLSAQCAYYFLLSLFPFLVFAITLLGFLPITSDDVLHLVYEHIPGKSNRLIEENIQSILDVKRKGALSLSIIFTLWTATKGMDSMIYALNKAYRIKEERSFTKATVLSFVLMIGMIFVILSALILTVFGEKIEGLIHLFFHIPDSNIFVNNVFRWIVNLMILTLAFTGLYYLAPNTCLTCKEVMPGAFIAAFGWQTASLLFSFYVNNFGNYTATYGSLGAVIILMTWFYLASMILMMGGIINAILPSQNTK